MINLKKTYAVNIYNFYDYKKLVESKKFSDYLQAKQYLNNYEMKTWHYGKIESC